MIQTYGVRELSKKKDFYCPVLNRRIKSCSTSPCKHFSEIRALHLGKLRICDYYFNLDKALDAIKLTEAQTPAELWVALYKKAYDITSQMRYRIWQPDYKQQLQPSWQNEKPQKMPVRALIEKAESNAIRNATKNSRVRCVTVRLKSIPLNWSEEKIKELDIHRVVNKFSLVFIIEKKKLAGFKSAVGVELEIKGDFLTE